MTYPIDIIRDFPFNLVNHTRKSTHGQPNEDTCKGKPRSQSIVKKAVVA